jgi:hypothetical protein
MAGRLAGLLAEANATCARLETVQSSLETTQQSAVDQVTNTQTELGIMMRIILDQSKSRIVEMTNMMQEFRDLTEGETARSSAPARRPAISYPAD